MASVIAALRRCSSVAGKAPPLARRPSLNLDVAAAAAVRAPQEDCDRLGVSAFYIARSIRLHTLFESESFGGMPVLIQRNNIVVTLSTPFDVQDEDDEDDSFDGDLLSGRAAGGGAPLTRTRSKAPVAMAAAPVQKHLPSYAVVFDYGAAVFVNADPQVHASVIFALQSHCEGTVDGEVMRLEDYVAVIDPSMKDWSRLDSGRDSMTLRQLDIHNLRIVAGVLGQSVSLQHYETQANAVLNQFRSHNDEIMKLASSGSDGQPIGFPGRFIQALLALRPKQLLDRQQQFALVAKNNAMLTDMITILGTMDRTGSVAWRFDSYYAVWESMRDEFELDQRFRSVENKISLIQDSTKFFLEVLADRKGQRLEWIIIILICGELGLGIYDHLPPDLVEQIVATARFWK